MAKAKKSEVTTENLRDDVAVLLGLKDAPAATGDASAIKRLIINADEVDGEGNEIPSKTFHIQGTKLYAKNVKFRPIDYYNRLLKQVQPDPKNPRKWETINETIFYKREQPIDLAGGVACGRVISGPALKNMTDSEREANKKKASFYGHLFGLVEFPGEEPVLVEWRMPGGKAKQVSEAIRELEKTGKMINFNLNLSLKAQAGTVHPKLEVSPEVGTRLPLDETIAEAAGFVLDFISSRNAWVAEQHRAAVAQRTGRIQDKALLNDLNDEIPFGDDD